MRQQPTRRKFWGKQTFFSICSKHYYHKENCNLCNTGTWVYNWRTKLNSFIWKFPRFALWYFNLPKQRKKAIEFTSIDGKPRNPFPNLK